MDKKKPPVRFADKELERDYERLANSRNTEERKLHAVLKRIRGQLRALYQHGSETPLAEIPTVYKRMFGIDNLRTLDLPPHGTVLFTKVGEELWIVDIV